MNDGIFYQIMSVSKNMVMDLNMLCLMVEECAIVHVEGDAYFSTIFFFERSG